LLGLTHSPLTFWIPLLALLIGLCFAGLGLIMTAVSPSYDFFMFYFTLAITPMTLLCGVFFPVAQLPAGLQAVSAFLPLTHAIDLARPLVIGQVPDNILLHIVVLLAYGISGFYIATVLIRRRLLR
ncbi:MAG: ABC transporter permease, partial [Burkholderiales bacterium]